MKVNELVLDLPDHGVKTKQGIDVMEIYDPFRRKWLVLTPEEWVRQHFLNYLTKDLFCPASLISVEHALLLNGLSKRADIVVHGSNGMPIALVECKAPNIPITKSVFEQAARYNITFKVNYLFITNGSKNYCCSIDHELGTVRFLDKMPDFNVMNGA